MKEIIKSTISFLIALVGFIGGGIWAYQTNWSIEPVILLIVSFLEIIGFLFMKVSPTNKPQQNTTSQQNSKNTQNISNKGTVKKQINIQNNTGKIEM
jgi:membrane protein implicated in regulation of membrane protease activity